jgi:hypothetical protein
MSNAEVVRVDLPLAVKAKPAVTVDTWTKQSAIIKQAPGYAAAPAVQAAVGDMDTAVANLSATLLKIEQTHAELSVLETTRGGQIALVFLKHDGVETALNTASNGDAAAAAGWTGKTKTRAKPVAVTADTSSPLSPAIRNVAQDPGAVRVSCNSEQGAVCYLFQQGPDATNPSAWPAPSYSKGHTFVARNQPIGQTVFFRIAIVRRGSVQSQWSPILQIVVR